MRKLFLSILFLMSGVALYAASAPGAACGTAITIGDNFNMRISGTFPQKIWYKANTFDLPLTVYFAPDDPTAPAPVVSMDFTCNPPYYEDSVLCSLFCRSGGSSGIDFGLPHKPSLDTGTLPDGTFAYYLSLGVKYRDLLLQMGVKDNLDVFVEVTYTHPGVISIAPDTLFSNCMDGYKFIQLGDTVQVQSLDKDRHVIVPYVQWQEDSIRYVWNGTQPVTLAVSASCDYDPTDNGDERILDFYTLQPQDTLKMTSEEVHYYVHADGHSSQAGMFYAKFYTEGTGVMKIERVPQAPPRGGATLLRYDRSRNISGDTTELYAISYTWTQATLFTSPTDHIFRIYVGTEPDFELKDAIATYQFNRNDTCHWLGLYEEQMHSMWQQTNEQYLYVRFQCSERTSVMPTVWHPSDCLLNTKDNLITKNSSVTITAKSTDIYRIYYNDWLGGDMNVLWDKNDKCRIILAKRCAINSTDGAQNYVVWTYEFKNGRKKITRTAEQIAAWADKVDAEADQDGYMYLRFYSATTGGTITLESAAPDEEDPAPIVYPASTIHVECGELTAAGQEYLIRVSAEQELHIDNETPWNQTPDQTPTVTLQTGKHTLYGADETIQIEVK